MNVLSLFDGMSCCQLALKKAGIKVDNYFASEIDKYAIKVTQANFPNTIQLGSVTELKGDSLPKIDLIAGGSPCQGFSFAGKGLNFDDPRSKLFFEFVRLVKECKPKYFLLENVMMEKWCQNVISKELGINPIKINSALVSAQNRERLYWTNIKSESFGLFGDLHCAIPQPKDKGIFLKDILQSEVDEKYYLSDKMMNYLNTRKANYNNGKINYKTESDKASCINASSGAIDISDNIIVANIKSVNEKASCFTAGGNSGGLHSQMDLIVHNMLPRSGDPTKGGTGHITRSDGKTYCLDTGNTNAVEFKENYLQWDVSGKGYNSQQTRAYYEDGRAGTLGANSDSKVILNQKKIRRLTEVECERLQTVPDNYTNHVSSTQRYRMLGNGWTISVIAHIFKYLNATNENE